MPITATVPQSANYAPKSDMTEGLHQVVVSKVEDLGMVPVSEVILAKNRAQRQKEGRDPNSVPSSVHKVRVFFQNAAGQIITRDYTLSLHEKAALAVDLKKLGKTFGESYDVEQLVGAQAQLMAEEATSAKGTKYVKIATLAKPAANQIVRIVAARPAGNDGTGISDADIPY